jgi:cell wall-associated NlpC family hydrolase
MEWLIHYALRFVNIPYVYGGNYPPTGLDCSGLCSEILKAGGAIGNKEDLTAQQLFERFQHNGRWNSYAAGSLVFYGESVTKISHVAWMIGSGMIIEAGGGMSTTRTIEEAKSLNAFVRVRQWNYRKDFVAIIRPTYPLIGAP